MNCINTLDGFLPGAVVVIGIMSPRTYASAFTVGNVPVTTSSSSAMTPAVKSEQDILETRNFCLNCLIHIDSMQHN